jgi:hypothetical protein
MQRNRAPVKAVLDDCRRFHAEQSGGTGGAEDFSAGLRQRGRQIFTLASL